MIFATRGNEMQLVMQSDPSLSKWSNAFWLFIVNDFRLVYERTCPFTLVLRDSDLKAKLGKDTVDEQEDLIVKLLVKGPDDNPAMVRIELLS